MPDWTKWSSRDPEPFPSLIHDEARYWASGKVSQAQFTDGTDADFNVLRLTGVLFDDLANIAQPWCPDLHLLPVDRLQNKTLQAWEVLAMAPAPSCPYEGLGGRYNAYWRTHIADYVGSRRATDKDKICFEAWANREAWPSRLDENSGDTMGSSWRKS